MTKDKDHYAKIDQRDTLARCCWQPTRIPPLSTPDHPIFLRCHTSNAAACAPCAELYRLDWRSIFFSGAMVNPNASEEEAERVSAALDGTSFLFLTLTAPSFGTVHRVATPANPKQRGQHCKRVHKGKEQGLAGVPIDKDSYKYRSQVLWNYFSSSLWNATATNLKKLIPGVQWAYVREWQARGAIHYHAILRLPKSVPATKAIAGKVKTCAKTTRTWAKSREIAWGKQAACEIIAPTTRDGQMTIGYLAKMITYSTKSFGDHLRENRIPSAAYDTLAQRLAKAAGKLKHPGHRANGCKSQCHTNWGARGSKCGKTRGWSITGLTRRGQKELRQEWAKTHGGAFEGYSEADVAEIGQMVKAHKEGRVWRRDLAAPETPKIVARTPILPAAAPEVLLSQAAKLLVEYDQASGEAGSFPEDVGRKGNPAGGEHASSARSTPAGSEGKARTLMEKSTNQPQPSYPLRE